MSMINSNRLSTNRKTSCFSCLVAKFALLILISFVNFACVTDSTSRSAEPVKDMERKAKAHSELASSYIRIDKLEIAQKELEKAFAADPEYSGTYFVAGVLALRLGLPKDAEKNFRIAAEDKGNSLASHELGVLLCRTGRAKESIAYFDHAISNPLFSSKGMSNLRAGECISKINTQKAQSYFSAALADNPNIIVALYRLAEVLYIEDELLRARAYLERFKSAAGASPQVLYLGYKIESKAKSIKTADEYSEQLLKQFPGSQEAKSLRKIIGLRG